MHAPRVQARPYGRYIPHVKSTHEMYHNKPQRHMDE